MTLVAWLLSARHKFIVTDARSYTSPQHSFPYYYPSFTADEVQTSLAKRKKAEQQKLILAREKVAWQNALHVVLSGFLYDYAPSLNDALTIKLDQLKNTLTYIKREESKEPEETKEPFKNNLHPHLNISSDSSSEESDNEDGMSPPTRTIFRFPEREKPISSKELAEYQANHQSLNVLTVKERANSETNSLVLTIVSAFVGDHQQFLELLASQDKEDLNTPLHCALKSSLPAHVFAPIFAAVKDQPNLDDFALKPDADGRTIFHYLSTKVAGFYQEVFGLGILQIGLTTIDTTGNTPLHIICQDNHPHKLADITLICKLALEVLTSLNSPRMRPYCATDKVQNRYYPDSEILNKLFGQADHGQTPLHHICMQTKEIPMQIDILKLFRTTLGEENYYKILLTPDIKGNLPTHYALHNLELLKCLLADLKPEQIKEISMTPNLKNENALQSTANHATAEVFGYLVDLLGHTNLYKCRQACPTLAMAAKDNAQIGVIFYMDTIKKYNALFDCVDYFLENKSSYAKYETGYLKRLNDFRACMQAIRNDLKHLPPEDPDFQNTGWMLFSSTDLYHDNRKYIKIFDAKKEIEACTTYFQTTELDAQAKAVIASIFNFSTPRLTPMKIAVGNDNVPPELHLPAPAVR